jgi:hypothetical protein
MEFKYQLASTSSGGNVLAIAEIQLQQSEVNEVQKSLLNNGWEVTAVHNHELFEKPFMICLHAQEKDNLNSVLKQIRDAIDKTKCDCT